MKRRTINRILTSALSSVMLLTQTAPVYVQAAEEDDTEVVYEVEEDQTSEAVTEENTTEITVICNADTSETDAATDDNVEEEIVEEDYEEIEFFEAETQDAELVKEPGDESPTSGTCGENVTWSYNKDTGVMTISGTGPMKDYYNGSPSPWFGKESINIKKLVVEEGVTGIGYHCFSGCDELKEVELPESLLIIGNYAFSSCRALTEIELPSGVMDIGAYAFQDCTGLKSIILPSTINNIGYYAFTDCTSLKSIKLPSGLKYLGYGAFDSCGIENIELPASLEMMDPEVFRDSSLKTVKLANGSTKVFECAFSCCHNLISVKLPDTVTSIETCAFKECEQLTEIELPSGLKNIGECVFQETGITEIEIPAGVENMECAFLESNIESISFAEGTSVIPDNFCENLPLTSVTIPSTVKKIGDNAFSFCDKLKTVNLSARLESIGDNAFECCRALTEISLPSGLKSIGKEAFIGCNLTVIELPASIENVGEDAFFEESNQIEKVVFAEGITRIPDGICSCWSIKSVKIPSTVTCIGRDAFRDCDELSSVDLPDALTVIEAGAFSGCKQLAEIALPSGLKSIGEEAFQDCCPKTIEFPASLETVGINAFEETYYHEEYDGIEKVIFAEGTTQIPDNACADMPITSVEIPSTVTGIGNHAFEDCVSLNKVDLPAGLESIGSYAFNYCTKLTDIKLPSSLKSIGIQCFGDCWKLAPIQIPDSVTTIYSDDEKEPVFATFNGDALAISEKYTNIEAGTFAYLEGINKLVIPVTVIEITPEIFDGCDSFPDIYYMGTEEEWNNIDNAGAGWMNDVEVYYNAKWPVVTSVSINEARLELVEGKTAELTAIVVPEDAQDKTVTWSSSHEAVATVDENGKVTALAAGMTTITVTAGDNGLTATCNVTVRQKKEIRENTFSLEEAAEGVSVINNSDYTLELEVDPKTGAIKSATIYGADGKVATAINSYLANIVTEYEKDGKTPKTFYTLVFTKGVWDISYDSSVKGAYKYQGESYMVAGGVVNQKANGLQFTGDKEGWKFMAAGRVVRENAGLVEYDGKWFWIDDAGSCDQQYAAIVNWSGADFLVHGGTLRADFTGFTYDPQNRDKWYHITNGQVWGDGEITDMSIEGDELTRNVVAGVVQ